MSFHPNWKSLATVDLQWKQFVREGTTVEPVSTWNEKHARSKNVLHKQAKPLTGLEAKYLYEEVIGADTGVQSTAADDCMNHGIAESTSFAISQSYRDCGEVECSPDDVSSKNTSITNNFVSKNCSLISFMRGAQENDVKIVSKSLAESIDINATDQFGWTALMCAACSGATDVVKLLLKSGADINITDKSGRNCMSLAKRQGQLSVVQIIEKSLLNQRVGLHKQPLILEEQKVVCLKNDIHCNICKCYFSESTRQMHLTSTVHLFNSRPKSLGTIYGIPESNKGYQILLKGGWDREQGLGPEGSGHKFPCKTVLKRDRTGLGKPQGKPRVTHFGPKEEASVRSKSKKMSKRQRHYERSTVDKKKERELRRELS